jgi:hypothetical protein
MDVRVDHAGDCDCAARIQLGRAGQPHPATAIDYRDPIAEDPDVGRVEFASIDVEQFAAPDYQVKRAVAASGLNQSGP